MLRLLGGLSLAGKKVNLKNILLLAYLLLEDTQSRQTLAELFFSEDEKRAQASLRAAVKQLYDAGLIAKDKGHLWALPLTADVLELQGCLRAKEHEKVRSLYRDSRHGFLVGAPKLRGIGDGLDSWICQMRLTLQEGVYSSRFLLAETLLAQGDIAEARRAAEEAADLFPLDVLASSHALAEACEPLLSLLLRCGSPQTGHFQQRLADESEEDLALPVMRRGWVFVGDTEFARAHGFSGREGERERLQEAFLSNVCLIHLTGRGGIGKTSLLNRVLLDLKEHPALQLRPLKVIYLRLKRPGDGERLLEHLKRLLSDDALERLEAQWHRNDLSLAAKLERLFHDTLADLACVFIIDNLEGALEGDTLADPFLQAFFEAFVNCHHSARLLLASREGQLPPVLTHLSERERLTLALEPLPLEVFATVLYERGADVAALVDSQPSEREAVAKRCYGLPKSIDALLSALRHEPLLTLAELLTRPELDALAQEPAKGLFESLSETEQQVLTVLAIYGKAVPQHAVSALLPEARAALNRLVRQRIVTFDDARCLSLHQLDQDYLYGQLEPSLRQALHRQAAAYYRSEERPKESWQSKEDVAPQLDGFGQLYAAGDYEEAAACLRPIEFGGLFAWGEAETVIRLRESLRERLRDPFVQGLNLNALGVAYKRVGHYLASIRAFEEAMRAAERSDHPDAPAFRGQFGGNLTIVYTEIGDSEKAVLLKLEGIASTPPDKVDELCIDYCLLGNAYLSGERLREAVAAYKTALEFFAQVPPEEGSPYFLACTYNGLADARLRQDPCTASESLAYAQKALELSRTAQDRRAEGEALVTLGRTLGAQGQAHEAEARLHEALELGKNLNDTLAQVGVLLALGNCYRETDPRNVLPTLHQALALALGLANGVSDARCLLELAYHYADAGDLTRSLALALPVSHSISPLLRAHLQRFIARLELRPAQGKRLLERLFQEGDSLLAAEMPDYRFYEALSSDDRAQLLTFFT